MHARRSPGSSPGYCARISASVQPSAIRSRINETQMRCPRMQGFPWQTLGSLVMRASSCSWVTTRLYDRPLGSVAVDRRVADGDDAVDAG